MKHAFFSTRRARGDGVRTGPRGRHGPPRRAVATLVVLLLIAITLAIAYASMRSQSTAVQIQSNASLRTAARQAAVTGITMALKNLHTSQWAGVDTTLHRSLGAGERFEVSFATGDPRLTPGHPDYEDSPYRVTLLSTGFAADPSSPERVCAHRLRAVVRLAPRQLDGEPSDWATMQRYTVYQWKKDSFELDIPYRLEGPVRVQGQLKLATRYPNHLNAWYRYLGDLNAMRLAGHPDYRPFNGPVDLLFSDQDYVQFYEGLREKLGVPANDLPLKAAAADWDQPTSLANYQIYPGGTVYSVAAAAGTLENTFLEPDPLTNPLGIYYRDTSIAVRDNVTVRGSLFCRDDIRIEGQNVHFQPVDMPALYGSDGPVRLPTACCRKFIVESTGGGTLSGLLAVFDTFQIDKSPATVSFVITGRVITDKFFIQERQPWETLNWADYYVAFLAQLAGGEGTPVKYFPLWMGTKGYDPKPLLIVKPDPPDPPPPTYHWKNPYNYVYVPHPDDASPLNPDSPGLRWEVVEWNDNP